MNIFLIINIDLTIIGVVIKNMIMTQKPKKDFIIIFFMMISPPKKKSMIIIGTTVTETVVIQIPNNG